jgi:hypothetical protein
MAEEQAQDIDAQKKYLMAKINELTDGIAPGYGEAFLEELMGRLEKTVSEFNEEVSELLESLKVRSAERDEKLKEMMEGVEDSAAETSPLTVDGSAAESSTPSIISLSFSSLSAERTLRDSSNSDTSSLNSETVFSRRPMSSSRKASP